MEFKNKSAVELIGLLSCGEVSSVELTKYFIQLIKQQDPNLNALVVPTFERALKQASLADEAYKQGNRLGLLHGLPVTVKECFDLIDTPSTFGLLNRCDNYPDKNDIYVQSLLDEGAVILGKSNVSQLLSFTESDNPVYGRTNHAHNQAFSCGGSSGGEGVLIGQGLSPLGIGTDIGGSVRIPAAVNGACGIKPTMGALRDCTRFSPIQDKLPVASCVGPIAQDAASLKLALDIMQKAASQRWDVAPFKNFTNLDITSLKVGFYVDDGLFPVSKPVREAIEKTIDKLKALNVSVTEFHPPNLNKAESIFYRSISINNGEYILGPLDKDKPAMQISKLAMLMKAPAFVRKALQKLLLLCGQKQQARIMQYLAATTLLERDALEQERKAYSEEYIAAMDQSPIGKLDAVIHPISAVPAYLHEAFEKMGLAGTYSLVHNVTGFPAGVANVATVNKKDIEVTTGSIDLAISSAQKCVADSEGMPLSAQIAARPNQEHVVLALIEALHNKPAALCESSSELS
ncbi:amidase family protein [Brumicola nitratireducens]|uniref:Amidase n=1 Tax=Glaciecola nitratireducens (strain JCM 12485 / KCTC 12276 / FR1064) TaxID=1085623 RepID=G4QIM3_GLANF|nr:amidase family protein [Glaciecola nitratireducens]AEP31178.1 amidase [Glaciecola nitratireducens FR1064]